MPACHSPPAPLAPLRHAAFRLLWSAGLVANLCMWMSDVAAAWTMTALAPSPVWVALVQTAATLPVFLFGLPSGALADMLDRRRYLVATQCWSAMVAAMLFFAVVTGCLTPLTLLALTFANGTGLAMRWPALAALVPGLVPRTELPAALALNGVSMNASRLAGPLLAGVLIAGIGVEAVFALNAALSLAMVVLLSRWRPPDTLGPPVRARLLGAIRDGLQFASRSSRVRAVLARVTVFFFHSTCLLALLPLVASDALDGGAGTFTLLLACMGAGAIAAAGLLPRLRQRFARDALVLRGALLHAAMSAAAALSHHVELTMVAMVLSGVAWLVTANSLSVSIQLALPDWIRARGMSIYQMALMGGSAAGAAAWGYLAALVGVAGSLLVAALSAAVVMPLVLRHVRDDSSTE
jgi:MFS family permease